MEPNISTPQFEQARTPESYTPPTVEQAPQLPTPEVYTPQVEQAGETISASTAAAVDATTAPVLPMPVAPLSTPMADNAIIDATELVAADDDLIEREWVMKAKTIIAATQDDPHAREEQVSALQREYLKKRYGRGVDSAL